MIVLNNEWVQFVLQNCEILHSVRGLYDKNSASWYYFTSYVMYKKYKRLAHTSPDLLARFCKENLSNVKNSAWFVFLMYCDREPLWLCYFLGVHIRLSSRCKINFTHLGLFANYFSLKLLSLSVKSHMNVLYKVNWFVEYKFTIVWFKL